MRFGEQDWWCLNSTIVREVDGWGAFFSAELVFLLFLLPVLGQKAPCSGSHRAVCVISPAPSQHSSTPPWKSPGCWVSCVISANKWVILHLLMLPGKASKPVMWNFRCLVQTDWLSLNTYAVWPRWRCLFFCKLPDEHVWLADGCSLALTVGKNWPLSVWSLWSVRKMTGLQVSCFL